VRSSPYPCGHVWGDAAIEGEVAHSCRHREGPQRIKVCVVKKDNTNATYAALLARMEEAPREGGRTEVAPAERRCRS
jgi:hypothetical protein